MIRTRSADVAVRLLREGKIVAFPTDTAYGLAVNAQDPRAVARLKRLKGRDARKAIALIAASTPQVLRFFRMNARERRLAERFWPGPLTLVLRPKALLVRSHLANGGIGVRVPASAVARKLAEGLGAPITATSANRAGKPTSFSPAAVIRAFPGRKPDALVLGSRLKRRPVSTVARVVRGSVTVLRPGAVPERKLHGLR